MFQNINEDTIEINNKAEKAKRNVNIFSNVLTKENLAIYVVAFMMSLVGIGGDFSIFSIDEQEELSGIHKKVNISDDSLLGKLFGYFFDN